MDYVVKEGDTLSEILYEATGDGTVANYEKVAASNNINNPDIIQPGQVIHIDDAGNVSISDPDSSNAKDSFAVDKNYFESKGGTSEETKASTAPKSESNADVSKDNTSSSSQKTSVESSKSTASTESTKSDTASKESSKSTASTASNNNSSASTESAKSSTPTGMRGAALGATATATLVSSSSNYKFTSTLEDDDDIQMDIEAASNYINGTMDADLGQMCNYLIILIDDLTTMQGRQYSKSGTNVDQDYADFETITEAISDFLVECNRTLDDINSYIEANRSTLYS